MTGTASESGVLRLVSAFSFDNSFRKSMRFQFLSVFLATGLLISYSPSVRADRVKVLLIDSEPAITGQIFQASCLTTSIAP